MLMSIYKLMELIESIKQKGRHIACTLFYTSFISRFYSISAINIGEFTIDLAR